MANASNSSSDSFMSSQLSMKDDGEPTKKSRGKGKDYKLVQIFPKPELALEWTKEGWRYGYTRKSAKKDHKVYYECNRARQCPARACLFYSPHSDAVTVKATEQHNHSQPRDHGFSHEIKEEIISLFRFGLETPTQIKQAVLSNRGVDLDKTK